MADDEEDSTQERQNLGDDLDQWWGKDGDSDSESEEYSGREEGAATYLEEGKSFPPLLREVRVLRKNGGEEEKGTIGIYYCEQGLQL